MSEQITLYYDGNKISPFCHRVEIALLEADALYTTHAIDLQNKPAWFTQLNPLTAKVPTITYGGPKVSPEDPSPQSFKLTESYVILEFIADVFPDSHLLPRADDPTGRARVRLFMDVAASSVGLSMRELRQEVPGAFERLVTGLEKIQSLLPDPDAADGGEYAIGKHFTIADCAIAPLFAFIEVAARTSLGLGDGKKLGEMFEGEALGRLKRYRKALWARESVKKVIDLDRTEAVIKVRFATKN